MGQHDQLIGDAGLQSALWFEEKVQFLVKVSLFAWKVFIKYLDIRAAKTDQEINE